MGNRYKDFYKILNEMDEKEHFEKNMLFMLAPVVGGFKPSSTITLVKSGNDYKQFIKDGKNYLLRLGLKYIVLRKSKDAIILLIYNKEKLRERIYSRGNKEFLRKLNYNLDGNLDSVLVKLKERYNLCHCPHELGILLGIPTEDVKDFMNCTKKKCLACGYWKVFNNYDKAIKTFKDYDDSKEDVVNLILNNLDVDCIIKSMKNKCRNKSA